MAIRRMTGFSKLLKPLSRDTSPKGELHRSNQHGSQHRAQVSPELPPPPAVPLFIKPPSQSLKSVDIHDKMSLEAVLAAVDANDMSVCLQPALHFGFGGLSNTVGVWNTLLVYVRKVGAAVKVAATAHPHPRSTLLSTLLSCSLLSTCFDHP